MTTLPPPPGHDADPAGRVGAVVVGAQKAGTTSLHAALAGHPEVAVPPVKETKFFVREEVWAAGDAALRAAFPPPDGRLWVEVDPDCMVFEASPTRIAAHNPDARIVAVLRDPLARLVSHYRMNRARGVEDLDLGAALDAEDERIRRDTTARIHFSYLTRSRYAPQVRRHLDAFETAQVLVLRFEDLVEDWPRGWRAITDHLGIAPHPAIEALPVEHTAAGVRSRRLSAWFYSPEGPVRQTTKRVLKRSATLRALADRTKAWNHGGRVPTVEIAPRVRDRLGEAFRVDAEALAGLVDFDPWTWPSLREDAP